MARYFKFGANSTRKALVLTEILSPGFRFMC